MHIKFQWQNLLFKLIAITQKSHVKNHVNAKTIITGQTQYCHAPNLNTEFDQNDRNALFTLKNYGGYNNHFYLAVFQLAEFFSGSFSVNAENIQLGG